MKGFLLSNQNFLNVPIKHYKNMTFKQSRFSKEMMLGKNQNIKGKREGGTYNNL